MSALDAPTEFDGLDQEIEAVLLASAPARDLSGLILHAIEKEREQRLIAAVLPKLRPRRKRLGLWGLLTLGLTGLAFAAVWMAARHFGSESSAPSIETESRAILDARETSAPNAERRTLPKAVQPPAPEPGQHSETKRPAVLQFDFEDDTNDGDFLQGQPVTEPCEKSRRCMMGTISPWAPSMLMVSIEHWDGPPLFHFNDRMVLSFDYWLGADAAPFVYIQIYDDDQRQNFAIYLRDVVHSQWTHAEVTLAELKGNVREEKPLGPGDKLITLLIEGGRTGGKPFYVDNIRVEERPDGVLPRSTAGGAPAAAH